MDKGGGEHHDIVIVGGGVSGLATALALHRVGLKSVVLERSSELRVAGTAFCMWPNAWKALEALGIAETIRSKYHLQNGLQGISLTTGYATSIISLEGKETRCIERSVLLEILAQALPKGTIRLNSNVVSIHSDHESDSIFKIIQLADGTLIKSKVIVGCDGVHSRVANWLGIKKATSANRCAFRGMANCSSLNEKEKLFIQRVKEGVRSGRFLCSDDKVYWFVIRKMLPSEKGKCKDWNNDLEGVKRGALEAASGFSEERELIEATPLETLNVAELETRWAWPWEWNLINNKKRMVNNKVGMDDIRNVALVGDAFHAITPDFGQGACLALEDSIILARCLKEEDDYDSGKWVFKYVRERKWRVVGVGVLAYYIGFILEGPSSISRFIRDFILLPLIGMKFLEWPCHYNCGSLF